MKLRDHTELIAMLKSRLSDDRFDVFGEMIRRMCKLGLSPLSQWRSILCNHLEMRDDHVNDVVRTLSSLPHPEDLITSSFREVPVSPALFRAFGAYIASVNPNHWLARYSKESGVLIQTIYDGIYVNRTISVGHTLHSSFDNGSYRLMFIEDGIETVELVRLERRSSNDAVLIRSADLSPALDSYMCAPFLLVSCSAVRN